MKILLPIGILCAVVPVPLQAKVVTKSPHGFQMSETVKISAPADRVWVAIGQVGKWWNPDHSYSGDPAKNLTLKLVPGGCLCESLPGGGGVKHLEVALVKPGEALHLWGALGPLHEQGVAGGLRILLAKEQGTTSVTISYTVGGSAKGGLDVWAPIVDGVLTNQLGRLKAFVETGRTGAK